MPASRHSRATIRYQRDRIVAKRIAQARLLAWQPVDPVGGRLEVEQSYLGCRRAHCGLCHPGKRWHRGADRRRDERGWRKLEELG
jgi:hypothetical protein